MMKPITFLFFFSWLLFFESNAQKECLRETDIKAITKSFNINLNTKLDPCDPQNRVYRVIEALNFIWSLKLNGPVAPKPYNQEIIGYKWIERIWKLSPNILWGPNSNSAASCKTALAFAGPAPYNLGKFYLCPNSFSSKNEENSVIDLVSTMIHETRHLENNGYHHVKCEFEKRTNKNGCDPSFNYKGAYAADVETLAKIGISATNVNPALKYHARRMAYVVASDRIVKSDIVKNIRRESVVPLFELGTGRRYVYSYRFFEEGFKDFPAGRFFDQGDGNFLLAPNVAFLPKMIVSSHEWENRYSDYERSQFSIGSVAKMLMKFIDELPSTSPSFLKGVFPIRFALWSGYATIVNEKLNFYLENDYKKDASKKFEINLPMGNPVRIRNMNPDKDGVFHQGIFILNNLKQLFQLTISEKTDLHEIKEIPNPFPVFIDIAQGHVLEETDAWEERMSKSYGNQNSSESAPPDKYINYYLTEEGTLFHGAPGETPIPASETSNNRFESMGNAIFIRPWLPKGLR